MRQLKYLLLVVLITLGTATALAQTDGDDAIEQVKTILSNGNSKEADKDIATIAKAFKKDAVVLTAIGREYLRADNAEKAEEYADMARAKDKKYGEAYILLGDVAIRNDDGGKAAEWFLQAMTMDPQNPEGYRRYAILMTKSSPEAAIDALQQLKANIPDYPIDLIAAEISDRSGNIKQAIEYYSKVSTSEMTEGQLASYATDLFLTGDFKKAVEIAQLGNKKNPRHAAFNRLSLYNYTELEDYDRALAFGDKLFNASDSAKITAYDYQYLGHANVGAKKYDDAIKAFQAILSLQEDPDEDSGINLADAKVDAMKQIADAYSEKEDYDQAIQAYQMYLQAAPAPTATDYAGLGSIYTYKAAAQEGDEQEKTVNEAHKVYDDLAAKFDDAKEFAFFQHARLAMMIDQDLKRGAAKKYYDKLIEIITADGDIEGTSRTRLLQAYQYNMIYALQILDDIPASKEYANKILELDPDNEQATQVAAL